MPHPLSSHRNTGTLQGYNRTKQTWDNRDTVTLRGYLKILYSQLITRRLSLLSGLLYVTNLSAPGGCEYYLTVSFSSTQTVLC